MAGIYARTNPKSFCHAVLEQFNEGLREAGHTNEVLDLYAIGFAHVKALILQTTICEKRATTRRRGPSSTSWRHGDVDELRPEGGVRLGSLEVVEQPRPAAETAAGCGCDAEHARPHRSASTTTCWTTDEALPDMAAKYSRNAFGSGASYRPQIVGPAVTDRLESQFDVNLVCAQPFRQRHLIASRDPRRQQSHDRRPQGRRRLSSGDAPALSKPRGSRRLSLR